MKTIVDEQLKMMKGFMERMNVEWTAELEAHYREVYEREWENWKRLEKEIKEKSEARQFVEGIGGEWDDEYERIFEKLKNGDYK